MSKDLLDNIDRTFRYEHRIMGTIIVSQLILIAVFRLWPAMKPEERTYQNFYPGEEVFVEEIVNTKQNQAPASPPKPQIPQPVPNDNVIEEEIEFPEFEDIVTENPIEMDDSIGRTGEGQQVTSNPQLPPTAVKIVEPRVPEEFRKTDLRVEIIVTFLVNSDGDVEELFISEIRQYNDNDTYEVVDQIGYGLMEATIQAASEWKFRAAKDQGRNVRTYTRSQFSFGF
ncbi:hypothetical protein AB2B38_000540 [Balneola sp. MJW-20]|uniref:hypothetical protein n=1 Tax=Gracilimonas aurantiaca TaxID=3234185 RepID=UPI0034664116